MHKITGIYLHATFPLAKIMIFRKRKIIPVSSVQLNSEWRYQESVLKKKKNPENKEVATGGWTRQQLSSLLFMLPLPKTSSRVGALLGVCLLWWFETEETMLCVELLGAEANSGWISLNLAGSLQGVSFYWLYFYWLLMWTCVYFQWSTAVMEAHIRGYFSSKARHPGGTYQITPSARDNQQKHLCPWEKIYPLKVFAFSQRRCNPLFLIQFPLCAMGAVAPFTVIRVFIWARRYSSVC